MPFHGGCVDDVQIKMQSPSLAITCGVRVWPGVWVELWLTHYSQVCSIHVCCDLHPPNWWMGLAGDVY